MQGILAEDKVNQPRLRKRGWDLQNENLEEAVHEMKAAVHSDKGYFKTNHSLIVTATSCLYQAGVDKQLVMERIGHCNV